MYQKFPQTALLVTLNLSTFALIIHLFPIMKNRRQFLLNSVIGLAAVTTLPASSIANTSKLPHRGRISSLADLNLASFQRLLRGKFDVRSAQERWGTLQLFQIKDHGPAKGEHFTLLFSGAVGRPLPQDTYYFGHPAAGYFSLMIVPGQGTRTRQVYTALINRTA